ncbi:MAG: metallophosphoesterase, partial [Desulfobacterales bacterium]|nr:metallophosphoesterase [Desulfobacterales bacterium]
MKKTIFLIIITFIFTTASAFAQNDAIKQLDTGFHGTQFMFTVFGDTRTSELESLDGHDVVFSLARNKVFQSIGEQLSNGNAAFSLFTGDLIWQGGKQVYWEEPGYYFPETVRKKIYPIPGNHETWDDPLLTNYFSFFPQLKKNHSYYFTCSNSLFISL